MNKNAPGVVRVGIAGLGRSGWSIHALTLEKLADKFQVAAVCDADAGRQREARERLGCRAYAQFRELLQDDAVELVVVAVPSHLHAAYACEALRAGKHVMVEKPMAASVQEVDEMIAVARQTGRRLTVFQNYRYAADCRKVREVIESGKLGRVVLIRMAWHGFSRRWDWQTLKEFNGGQLNNTGAHAVDLALRFFADVEPEVTCHAERTPLWSGDAESHAKIILRAPGRPMIDIELTCACAYPQERWLVMGTQGGLSGSAKKLCWKYLDPQALPPRPVTREPTPDRSYQGNEPLPWREEVCDLTANPKDADQRLYLDLFETLRHGAPLAITPESVRRTIAVLEACHRQAAV